MVNGWVISELPLRFAMIADQSSDVLAIIIKCVNFAAVKHKNQRRKDPEKTPYINHAIGKKIMEQRVITKILKLQICLCSVTVLYLNSRENVETSALLSPWHAIPTNYMNIINLEQINWQPNKTYLKCVGSCQLPHASGEASCIGLSSS